MDLWLCSESIGMLDVPDQKHLDTIRVKKQGKTSDFLQAREREREREGRGAVKRYRRNEEKRGEERVQTYLYIDISA